MIPPPSIVGSLRDREVACSASHRQGSNFESCVWRTVSSQSSHHPHEVLLTHFSLYVHKGGLKPDLFHLPTHPLPIFSRILGFFKLDKTPNLYRMFFRRFLGQFPVDVLATLQILWKWNCTDFFKS